MYKKSIKIKNNFFIKTILLFIVLFLITINLTACDNKKKELEKSATVISNSISNDETKKIDKETYPVETSSNVIGDFKNDDTKNKEKGTYPKVDGSTANMPLMAQIRSDYLKEDIIISQNKTNVTTTDYAWRSLINGNADLLLVYEASSETKKILEESDVKLKITPIGVDALVFIENEENPINNLTTEQLQKIYTGEIKKWSELGGEDITIQSFQRPLNSGSQTLFLKLLMKELTPKKPLSYEEPAEMESLINVLADYNNSKNAIGYSVYYYTKKMYQVPGLKLISVDGVMPSDESIGNGTYPFLNTFYLVIREDEKEDSETMKLYKYILSDKGKEVLIKSGYIPYTNEK